MKRNRFFVIEGIDGAGKETQTKLLLDGTFMGRILSISTEVPRCTLSLPRPTSTSSRLFSVLRVASC